MPPCPSCVPVSSRWCTALQQQYGSSGRLSFYEPRLEFWRQLWRVLERSDVALIIVDARWGPLCGPEATVLSRSCCGC